MSLLTKMPTQTNHHRLLFPSFPPSPHAFQIREFRVFRRRRLKHHHHHKNLTLRCQLGNPSSFHDFVSHLPSPDSVPFLAPAIGFVSGAALFLSNFSNSSSDKQQIVIGEWLLLTSPTPFNRSVQVRCPSISLELLDEVDEKVVKEGGEFMRVNSGRIFSSSESESGVEDKLEYQRLCVRTEDGGVVALDWPASLDLEEEQGLDTTLILVPGTAQGSMDPNVRSFVCDALGRGFFPIVINPRGCAGSPLTTPRLFSAADSDDVSAAVQFINKARSGTTLVGVGWGYGANMLTKYLAEIGESSPLTAATCIDNPFDLVEATKSSPNQMARDQQLTDGLIDILRSNKELFQGKAKGFDVEQALSAKSVREFEKAISMVSHGFDAIEDFYSKASTRGVVGNVKIPVLFIQKDDELATPYSIPRSLIAENPFTSLLFCCCLPSRAIDGCRSVLSWCQHLTIEWLTAVELGLLKGRHPLLKDVDIPFEPSRELAHEGRDTAASFWLKSKNDSSNGYTMSQPGSLNGYTTNTTKKMFGESDSAASFWLASKKDSYRKSEAEHTELQGVENGALNQTHSDDPELVNEEEVGPADGERGQVLQTAQVVMNMLDVTMPNVLTEEKKKKVLTAVGKGDTLMQALQDAVPEDVRGKLTDAVSGVLHAQGPNLKFDQLLGVARIPDISSGLKSKFQDEGISSSEGAHEDHHSSDLLKKSDDLLDSSVDSQPAANKPPGELESESLPTEQSPKISTDQSLSTDGSDISASVIKDTTESESSDAEHLNNSEKGSEQTNSNNSTGIAGSAEGAIVEDERHQDGRATQLDTKDEEGNDNQKKDNKNTQPIIDQNTTSTSDSTAPAPNALAPNVPAPNAPAPAPSTSDSNAPAPNAPAPNVPAPSAPAFSVSEAFDALTGMDDSTQMAVNNVFGVLENMITQLEESSEHENEEKKSDSAPVKDQLSGNNGQEDSEASKLDQSIHTDGLSDVSVSDGHVDTIDQQPDVSNVLEEKHTQSPVSVDGNSISSSQGSDRVNHVGEDKVETRDQLVGINRVNNIPPCLTSIPPCITSISSGVHNYLLSKVRAQSLDLDSTAALLLDYFPEEGTWKVLEQPGPAGSSVGDAAAQKVEAHKPVDDEVIEPSYVILDTEKHQEPIKEYEAVDNAEERVEIGEDEREDFGEFVRNIILDSLTVEVGRRQGADDIQKMEPYLTKDLEQVATAVSLSVGDAYDPRLEVEYHSIGSEKVGTLHGEHVIKAISSAVQETSFLRRVVPVGVIVGSSLAALRKYFIVATVRDSGQIEPPMFSRAKVSGENVAKVRGTAISLMPDDKSDDDLIDRKEENTELKSLNNSVMVGAVTAAIGASALLAQHQDSITSNETSESSLESIKMNGNGQMKPDNHEESSDKHQSNIVTSLAEKAMSVAAPVVPKRQDGGLDQERLLTMLVDMGQRGGMLRLVGKLALLWGGMRGAMSLTDKLIQFLHLSERPLIQRILGFAGMTLVLWSPVVVPLLPTFMQSWATKTPSRIADLACIVGLYAAFMLLVTIWGKRIRGYEDPLAEYGLDLMSLPKLFDFFKGLIGGVVLVLSIQSANTLLGCVNISWPSTPSSLDAMKLLSVYGHVLTLIGQSIMTATGVAIVEELFFRSWLPQEIAADLGYHRSIILSGLVFTLCQRSLWAIPGLWLLSVSLAGARQRNQGSLAIPIGLRAGIIGSSFILQKGGFLTYRAESPLWIIGTHQFQPFSGLTGFAFALLLAIILYPTVPLPTKTLESTAEE
uniref:uncharacterized protein LOC101295567 isoform X1 n=1 Tax=Fragaria vesca subsp. vesca TaxID=101020 RepID=UPI0005C94102|nr:PREDICTED: uncharacterized protein LOC101295567 isoform X1 [Fragaria vesca subsp. vesca]